jgi:hypothetical protein
VVIWEKYCGFAHFEAIPVGNFPILLASLAFINQAKEAHSGPLITLEGCSSTSEVVRKMHSEISLENISGLPLFKSHDLLIRHIESMSGRGKK